MIILVMALMIILVLAFDDYFGDCFDNYLWGLI